ncbi:MAG: N-acetyltransferase [Rhodobacteraceae bacterium]|nr:N-acetyltransferase [Paracoccaceae bacterium]
MITLAPESPEDVAEVEALFDLAFAPGREALSSYRLREGVAPVAPLCLVARDSGGWLAGAIRFWPVALGDGGVAGLLLGPVAVHPTRQGEGVGGLLIEDSLARARAAGWQRVLLVGDAPYYGRFGFARVSGLDFPPPTNPDRLLGLELVPGALEGLRGPVARWTGPPSPEQGDTVPRARTATGDVPPTDWPAPRRRV